MNENYEFGNIIRGYSKDGMNTDRVVIFNKWDKRFMEMAQLVATWSSCYKKDRHVGAVIVKDKRILATGYNGAPSRIKTCVDKHSCMRMDNNIESGTHHELCYAAHAEQNAIIQAAKFGISINGSTMYCTHAPCSICAKMIINSGIIQVIYHENYPDEFGKQLMEEAGIKLEQF